MPTDIIHSTPSPARAILRGIDALTAGGNLLSALCLLAIFGFVGAEIVMRNLAGVSVSFSWDVAAYLMGACFLLASASALRAGTHVRVTALAEVLPPRAAWALDLAAGVIGLAVTVLLVWALGQMAWLSGMRGSTSPGVVRIPLVVPQGVLTLGAALLCLQMAAQVLRVLSGERLAVSEGLE
ncbi:TRAP transporter small permease subunit [Falsirhodobacter halotolerans]|uniref:TRAP transporter small permease subunit n=1 Tax=Falsirhodobacter halotolerans TaxID=1146892 RepID=UPI001FD0274F|nr:TRAP transporter small permease [Falsirhodobacter halotolerans]MCJ8140869.1 TRAP transporter small permease [Falsirhodobacter halotolerans]